MRSSILWAAWCGLFAATSAMAQVPAGHGFLEVDDSRLYYEECGSGPAIVLLHDGLTHAVSWDAIWPLLCARHHVLRYDRRGMGRSSPPRKPFAPVEDLAALLRDRGIGSATLVGSSSGAGLAIDFAIRHRDDVARLVLLGPVLHGMASSAHFTERGDRNNAPLAHGGTRAAARNWANDRYQIARGHEAARHTLFETLAANPQNLRYRGDLELRSIVPAAALLGEIRAPALILVGASDIPDVHAYAGAIELGISGAIREVVAEAGHLIQLEAPAFVARRIQDFVVTTPTVSVSVDSLHAFAGTYAALMNDRPGEFLVRDGRLMLHVATERDTPLFASNDSTFYLIAWGGVRFTFRHDSAGAVRSVNVQEGSAAVRPAGRISLPPPP